MIETAYAKINLALHVRRRRPDGYHHLETLFAFSADGDKLSGGPAERLTLKVEGPFARDLPENNDNLVLRAARRLQEVSGCRRGAALILEKCLPVASGIGGGSADAAAALRLLARLWKLDLGTAALAEIARPLGADVPACVYSRALRGEGAGEALTEIRLGTLAEAPVLLVNPLAPLSTASVFASWDGVDRGALGSGGAAAAALCGRNDLQDAASQHVPDIGEILAELHRTPGTLLVRMSGSGATCFALFEEDGARDAAADIIARAHPDWWLLASRLRGLS